MTEKAFENALKDAIKRYWPKRHSFKIASAWVGGLLDLYIRRPKFEPLWLELKYVDVSDRKSGPPEFVNIKLSGQQRNFIRKEKRAGGNAGWMVCVRVDSMRTILYSSHDADCQKVSWQDLIDKGCPGTQYSRPKEQLQELLERCYERTETRNSI